MSPDAICVMASANPSSTNSKSRFSVSNSPKWSASRIGATNSALNADDSRIVSRSASGCGVGRTRLAAGTGRSGLTSAGSVAASRRSPPTLRRRPPSSRLLARRRGSSTIGSLGGGRCGVVAGRRSVVVIAPRRHRGDQRAWRAAARAVHVHPHSWPLLSFPGPERLHGRRRHGRRTRPRCSRPGRHETADPPTTSVNTRPRVRRARCRRRSARTGRAAALVDQVAEALAADHELDADQDGTTTPAAIRRPTKICGSDAGQQHVAEHAATGSTPNDRAASR